VPIEPVGRAGIPGQGSFSGCVVQAEVRLGSGCHSYPAMIQGGRTGHGDQEITGAIGFDPGNSVIRSRILVFRPEIVRGVFHRICGRRGHGAVREDQATGKRRSVQVIILVAVGLVGSTDADSDAFDANATRRSADSGEKHEGKEGHRSSDWAAVLGCSWHCQSVFALVTVHTPAGLDTPAHVFQPELPPCTISPVSMHLNTIWTAPRRTYRPATAAGAPRQSTFPSVVARYSRPFAAAMPSNTGGASSAASESFLPPAAAIAHTRPPRWPFNAATCSASAVFCAFSSGPKNAAASSNTSGGPAAKSVWPARTIARAWKGGSSMVQR